ncbi:aldehyde dehydrogenase family protein, partial [Achromobacter insolitus]
MQLTGEMLIGRAAIRGQAGSQRAFNPTANAEIPEPEFGLGSREDVERAVDLATRAFDSYRNLPLERRAAFLEAIAEEILALGDAL